MSHQVSPDIRIALYLKAMSITATNSTGTYTSPLTGAPCSPVEYARHTAAEILQIIDTYLPFDKTILGRIDPTKRIKEADPD